MTALVVSFEVPTSPEETFEFIAVDYFRNHARWDPGVVTTAPIGGTRVRPGLHGEEVRRFLGTRSTVFEVTDLRPPALLQLRDEPGTWDLTRTYRIEPLRSGARVTFEFEMSPRARWFRAVHPLARPLIERQVRENMKRLQQLLTRHPDADAQAP